jgi:hypothetical protein
MCQVALNPNQQRDNFSSLNLSSEIPLKVPKRENFLLAFFALSEPTWVCDLGSGEKNRIFYQMTPDFEGLWFFAAY